SDRRDRLRLLPAPHSRRVRLRLALLEQHAPRQTRLGRVVRVARVTEGDALVRGGATPHRDPQLPLVDLLRIAGERFGLLAERTLVGRLVGRLDALTLRASLPHILDGEREPKHGRAAERSARHGIPKHLPYGHRSILSVVMTPPSGARTDTRRPPRSRRPCRR